MLARRLVSASFKGVRAIPKIGNRSLSTMLEGKERAEESRYIKRMEAQREEEIRQNLERILALEAGSKEKEDLVELLSKKEEKKGVVELLKDWKFALPVGIILGIPAIVNENIIINEELQLTGCFILFCATMYTQVGPIIASALGDYRKGVEQELQGVDSLFTRDAKELIAENNKHLEAVQEFQDQCALVDDLASLQAETLNKQYEHDVHEKISKKLEALVVLEENAFSAIRSRTVSAVKSDVVALFSKDKAAQEKALSAAIAVLAGGQGAKLGSDVVGEAFVKSFSAYKANYAKADPSSDKILTKLGKDIDAIMADASELTAYGNSKFLTNIHPDADTTVKVAKA